ncbi:MAG TPA: hypothetical protein DCM08_04855, partial [Microscillaceae bacterium]|nr:hypothetical protein [Microscillaceae bacterium]
KNHYLKIIFFTLLKISGQNSIIIWHLKKRLPFSASLTIGTINRTQTSLPISLLNFDAKVTASNQVKINWQTATEINNDRFEIQRSANTDTWETVAQVKGAGNSAQFLAYEATDNNPLPGISYYRLKQIDLVGTFSYSNIVGVNVLIINNLKIYPNPTDQLITVENLTPGDHQCQLFDPAGSEVSGSVRFNRISDSKMTIDLQLLPSGVYILVVDTQTFRIIKS